MKLKKIISSILTIAMLASAIPVSSLAHTEAASQESAPADDLSKLIEQLEEFQAAGVYGSGEAFGVTETTVDVAFEEEPPQAPETAAAPVPKEGNTAILPPANMPQGKTADGYLYTPLDGTYCTVDGYEGTAKDLVIPSTMGSYKVQCISQEAFKGNESITRIELPDTVETIGSYAFEGCTSLAAVVLNKVNEVGAYAFADCTTLPSVTIPESVRSIGNGAFRGCTALASASLACLADHVPQYMFSGCTALAAVTLPNDLNSVGTCAFQDCTSLKSIRLPDSITALGENAFYGCSSLETVNFPGCWETVWGTSDNDSWVNSSPFRNCESLKKITVPAGVATIPAHAFEDMDSLETIVWADTVTAIGDYAFEKADGIKSIVLPSSVREIGQGAFSESGIESISFGENVATIAGSAFRKAEKLAAVDLSNTKVTEISGSAFSECTGLKSVALGGNVTKIGSYAFSKCEQLAGVTLSEGLESVCVCAFSDCKALKSIQLPKTVRSLGERAFSGCEQLSQVNYPAGWEAVWGESDDTRWVDASPFCNCPALTSITVPDGITAIPAYAFDDMDSLETIRLPASLATIGEYVFANTDGLKQITLPANVTEIKENAFYRSGLESADLSATGLTQITRYVFSGCAQLADVRLPDGLTAICSYAFNECVSLESIRLPDGITALGEGAFSGAIKLSQVNYPKSWTTVWDSSNGESWVNGSPFRGCEALKTIDVPEGITAIPAYAFAEAKGLGTVSLPGTLKGIGKNAFAGCVGLKEMTFTAGLTDIAEYAFYNCAALTAADLSGTGLERVRQYVFSGCTGLNSVKLPNGLKQIESYAFSNCTSLVSLRLPSGITAMGQYAFQGCSKLSNINYPAAWTTVWDTSNEERYAYASPFAGCDSLRTIEVPKGVTALPAHAFEQMTALKTVILPDSMAEIGEKAFRETTGLENIRIWENVATIAENSFEGTNSSLTIYGVSGSYANTFADGHEYRFEAKDLVLATASISVGFSAGGKALAGVAVDVYDVTDGYLQGTQTSGTDGQAVFEGGMVGHTYLVSWYHRDYAFDKQEYTAELAETGMAIGTQAGTAETAIAATDAKDFTYQALNGTYCEITGYTGNSSEILIPESIDGYIVQRIGDGAFRENQVITRVKLADSVESIGSSAFNKCKALKEFIGGKNLTELGYGSFTACESLERVKIGGRVTEISRYAFSECTGLKSIALGGNVSKIGSYAFSKCEQLSGVTLSEGLESICVCAFSDCKALKSIQLPKTVRYLGERAFSGCEQLSQVNYPVGWEAVWGESDDTRWVDSSPFYNCPALMSMTVPEGITAIPAYAFDDMDLLAGITLPASLATIGEYAFANTDGLKQITLPSKVAEIKENAFYRSGLETVDLSATGLTQITRSVFSGCAQLADVRLPDGLTAICSYAFNDCVSLESIRLPDGITALGEGAFSGATKLSQVNYPKSWTTVWDGSNEERWVSGSPFRDCDSLKTIEVPEGITAIPAYAFAGVKGLGTVSLPGTLKEIGKNAFAGCVGLKEMAFPAGLTDIAECAFKDCPALTTADLSGTALEGIRQYVFSGCTGLISVSLPDGLKRIESYAFSNSTSLVSLRLPAGITALGEYAFQGCSKLSDINYPAGWTTVWDTSNEERYTYASPFAGCDSLKTMEAPKGVTAVPAHAFAQMTSLKTVILPDSVTEIGEAAFRGTTGLENIRIWENVATIAENSFEGTNSNLTIYGVRGSYANTFADGHEYRFEAKDLTLATASISVGFSTGGKALAGVAVDVYDVTDRYLQGTQASGTDGQAVFEGGVVGHTYRVSWYHRDYAFDKQEYTAELTTAGMAIGTQVGTAEAAFAATDAKDFTYQALNGTYCEITGYTGNSAEILIPESIDGYIVQRIGDGAFSENQIITRVKLADSVESIGHSAFYRCEALKEFIGGKNLSKLGNNSFQACASLERVKIGGRVTEISSYAFSECTGLKSIALGGSVTKIGGYAFQLCEQLAGVTLSDGLESVCVCAFSDCKALKGIQLPKTVRYLGERAFSGCEQLSQVNYPAGWEAVWGESDDTRWADVSPFCNCPVLTAITVPEGITAIPAHAFADMDSLETITLPASLATIGEYAFANADGLKQMTLPKNVTRINGGAFYRSGLESADLSATGVTEITSYVFSGCAQLADIRLPEGLTVICSYAFSDCASLESIRLPDGITALGEGAFGGATKLSQVNYPKSWTTVWDSSNGDRWVDESPFRGCDSLKTIEVPEGVTAIPAYAFRDVGMLRNVTLPKSLKSIGQYAFQNCIGIPSIILPENLTSIDAYAFDGCRGLVDVVLPDPVASLGSYALADCRNLESVTVSFALTDIDENAFRNDPKLTIYCPAKSKAAVIAVAMGIPLVMDEREMPEFLDSVLEVSRCNYDANYKDMDVSGSIAMTLEYALNEKHSTEISNLKLKLCSTKNVKPIATSLYLDGELVHLFDLTDEDSVLTLPVAAARGTLRFFYRLNERSDLRLSASMVYTYLGVEHEEVIDVINEKLDVLTLEVPGKKTSSKTVRVKGVAPPRTKVDIFLDGKAAGSVYSNQRGNYTYNVQLGDPANMSSHTIEAVTEKDGNRLNASASIQYVKDSPELEEFYMIHAGKKVDLLHSPQTPSVALAPGSSMTFVVKYTNPDKVDQVVVSSDKNNYRYTLPAKYDPELDAYVAEGLFDPKNPNFTPEHITVGYKPAISQTIPDRDTLNLEDLNIDKVTIQNVSYEKNTIKASTTGGEMFGEDAPNEIRNKAIDVTLEMLSNVDEDLISSIEWGEAISNKIPGISIATRTIQYLGEGVDNERYLLNIDLSNPGDWTMIAADVTETVSNVYKIRVMMDGENPSFGLRCMSQSLAEKATTMGMINEGVHGIMDAFAYGMDELDLLNYIDRSPTIQDKAKAKTQVALTSTAFNLTKGLSYAIPIIITGLASGGVTIPLAVAAGLTIVLWKAIGAMTDKLWEDYQNEVKSGAFDARWSIDPSGFIYEAVTSNRLQGATAEAWWVPYDENDPAFWDKAPEDDAGILWDATEWEQVNPVVTDETGEFEWMVPEGWWQVRCHLDGYQEARSAWMCVAPPQTGIQIPMVSLAQPAVENVTIHQDRAVIGFNKYLVADSIQGIRLLNGAGEEIPYTLVCESETAEDGTAMARMVTLTFNGYTPAIGEQIQVVIPGGTVRTYAGISGEEISRTVEYAGEQKLEGPENVVVIYGQEVPVEIKRINFTSDAMIRAKTENSAIASVRAAGPFNEEDVAVVTLFGEYIGDTILTVDIPNTDISVSIPVRVISAGSEDPFPEELMDLNQDGVSDGRDVIRLLKYMAGEEVDISELKVDINKDGTVDIHDLEQMMNELARPVEKAETEPDGERLPGDANNDEEVNEKDILILVRYLGGEEVNINLLNADVNGDQLVDGRDAIHLMKYLAGEDDIELV